MGAASRHRGGRAETAEQDSGGAGAAGGGPAACWARNRSSTMSRQPAAAVAARVGGASRRVRLHETATGLRRLVQRRRPCNEYYLARGPTVLIAVQCDPPPPHLCRRPPGRCPCRRHRHRHRRTVAAGAATVAACAAASPHTTPPPPHSAPYAQGALDRCCRRAQSNVQILLDQMDSRTRAGVVSFRASEASIRP